MRSIIVANWKMNLDLAAAVVLAEHVKLWAADYPQTQIILAPSLPWLVPIHETLVHRPSNLFLASQVVSSWPEGAYTGDVAATQLKKLVSHCLVGHSERRRFHHETPEQINDQIKQLLNADIIPIICFGEAHKTTQGSPVASIIANLGRDLHGLSPRELERCLFAYEPLWAIGKSRPAESEYIQTVVSGLQEWFASNYELKHVPILYGGSVNPDEAKSLGSVEGLSGLLVGGASLNSQQFQSICAEYGQQV